MNITITGTGNVQVTEAMRQYALLKLERVRKVFDHVVHIVCSFSTDSAVKDKQTKHKVSVRLHTGSQRDQSSTNVSVSKKKGSGIFVEQEHSDMYAAIDLLIDCLVRQIKELKVKTIKRSRAVQASAKRLHGEVFGTRRYTPA